MKNRNSKPFAATLCAAVLLHAGALALIPDISRRAEEKPAKTPVQITLSFPQEVPELPLPLPPAAPKQAEAREPQPVPPLIPQPEPDSAGEARGFSAEPAAVVTGTGGGGTSGTFDPNIRANLLLRYEAGIRLLIDKRKEYPYQARRQDQEGTVEISFVLSRQGRLLEEPVLGKKTRYRLLNNAALEAVKKAVPYPPFPPEFPEEKMAFSITLVFSLTGNTF
jgi:protein TonB